MVITPAFWTSLASGVAVLSFLARLSGQVGAIVKEFREFRRVAEKMHDDYEKRLRSIEQRRR